MENRNYYEELCQSPNNDLIINYLSDLPDENDQNYVVKLIALVENSPIELRYKLYQILNNEEYQLETIRFHAFYCLTIFIRRYKNSSELENLIFQHGENFAHKPLYNIILSTFYKSKGSLDDLYEAIHYATLAKNSLLNHKGVLQHYADIVASSFEMSNQVDEELLNDALNSIQKAIQLDSNYAKYYCTKGRLLVFKKEFKKAMFEIKKAIDKENPDKKDYAIRIGDYQFYLLKIQALEMKNEINGLLKDTETKVETTERSLLESVKEVRTKNLEFLAFFASILSFTIGSLSLADKKSFLDAALLILVLTGSLLIVYSAFRLLLRDAKQYIFQTLVLSSIGILLIVSSIMVGIHAIK